VFSQTSAAKTKSSSRQLDGEAVGGTTSVPSSADRSCHLPTTDETPIDTSARYDGALEGHQVPVICGGKICGNVSRLE